MWPKYLKDYLKVIYQMLSKWMMKLRETDWNIEALQGSIKNAAHNKTYTNYSSGYCA